MMNEDIASVVPTTLSNPLSEKTRREWLIPAGLILLSFVPALGGVAKLTDLAVNTVATSEDARFASNPLPMIVHVVSGLSFSILGALQFAPAIRRTKIHVHRIIGRLIAPAAVMLALSGMWITLFFPPAPHDGIAIDIIRVIVGSLIIGFLALALFALRRRDITAHSNWITRCYALAMGAGTQVFTLLPWLVFPGIRNVEGRAVTLTAGWVINLAVAEWVIHKRQRKTLQSKNHRNQVMNTQNNTMDAVIYQRYGGPEVLQFTHVAKPQAKAGEVLVRIHATAMNAMDYRLMRANPFLARFANGLFHPKQQILGTDIAGVVEAVGSGVSRLSVGDTVFGETGEQTLGGFAEFVCVQEKVLQKIPQGVGFTQAAALPLAGVTALQAVRDAVKVQPGHSVLIQGAGGGVGTFLVQIAKMYGAKVTAVCGPASIELVRSLGADRIIDYTQQDIDHYKEQYDGIFGVNGHRSLSDYRKLLTPKGTYVMVGGDNRQIFEALLLGKLRFAFSDQRIEVLQIDQGKRSQDLAELALLLANGTLRAVIDRVFPLAHTSEAMTYLEQGHVRGKVVLQVMKENVGN